MRSKHQIETNIRLLYKTYIFHLVTHPFSSFIRLCVACYSVVLFLILMVSSPVVIFTTGYKLFSTHPKKRWVLCEHFLKINFLLSYCSYIVSVYVCLYMACTFTAHTKVTVARELYFTRGIICLCVVHSGWDSELKNGGETRERGPLSLVPSPFFHALFFALTDILQARTGRILARPDSRLRNKCCLWQILIEALE